jgi:hypothetical protein
MVTLDANAAAAALIEQAPTAMVAPQPPPFQNTTVLAIKSQHVTSKRIVQLCEFHQLNTTVAHQNHG